MDEPEGNLSKKFLQKRSEAMQVITGCRTEHGFYASTKRYHQHWLRDMVYSEDALIETGYGREIENHLSQFIKLQHSNGQIPAVIDYTVSKLRRQTFQRCPADTEILFVIGMLKHAEVAGSEFLEKNKQSVDSCASFIQSKLNDHQLIPGMDWRDAMPVYVGKCLLANQMLLSDMYDLLGNSAASRRIKENVNDLFYLDKLGWYADEVHWEDGELKQVHHFDSFGNALAVLNGTASGKNPEGMLRGFGCAKTAFGYRNIMPYYEFDREKALATWYRQCRVAFGVAFRNRPNKYQNSALWPFVEVRVIAALRKLHAAKESEEATSLLIGREGFNEFYDPETGRPEGSEGQLWTAAAVISAIGPTLATPRS